MRSRNFCKKFLELFKNSAKDGCYCRQIKLNNSGGICLVNLILCELFEYKLEFFESFERSRKAFSKVFFVGVWGESP